MKRIPTFLRAITIFFLLISIGVPCLFDSEAYAISIKEEEELGKEFLRSIKRQYALVEEDFSTRFINDLGAYLSKSRDPKHFRLKFYILKHNTLNAFAAPGGHIFIFSGLIETFDDIDELAGVITHEIGHVAARHLSQRIEQGKRIGYATLAGVLAGVLIGGEAAEALITGSMAANLQAQLQYSRTDERQADQLGFKYMKASGFEPQGMLSTLNKLEKGNWYASGQLPAYLLTHPTGPERMANLDAMISSFRPGVEKHEEVTRFTEMFPIFKAVLRATCLDSFEAERLFRLDLEKDSEALLPLFGLGLVYKEGAKYEKAIYHFKKALEKDHDNIPVLTHLGEAYRMSGDNRTAIVFLERALRLDSKSDSARFHLAFAYEKMENYEKAIPLFERLVLQKGAKNEVYYHLGLSYGKSDRLPLAHYNFGRYFMKIHSPEKARFHFEKAEALAEGMPELTDKIRKQLKALDKKG